MFCFYPPYLLFAISPITLVTPTPKRKPEKKYNDASNETPLRLIPEVIAMIVFDAVSGLVSIVFYGFVKPC